MKAEDGEVIVGKEPKTLLCANAPCPNPGIARLSLVRDGKTLHFCSDRCLAEYRKKN